ncbi:hypothetical protein H6F89_25945 [Cyanobacteria bacterium FACHB-63]|nr:hypothetical protein [Cyanobacteria bacterium FACHB-63]
MMSTRSLVLSLRRSTFLLLCISSAIIASTQSSSAQVHQTRLTAKDLQLQPEPYRLKPRIVPDQKIAPDVTSVLLNGAVLNHLMNGEVRSGIDFGEGRSGNVTFNGTIELSNQIQESITRNNVLTLEQRAEYLQLMTVLRERKLTIEQRRPYTMLGQRLQMSLVANCTLPGVDPKQKCNYTPGLVIDESALDPSFLIPTRVRQTANVGTVVTPESIAEMQKPGFQRGANGQEVALDALLINSGAYPGNQQSRTMSVDRQENFSFTPAALYSRVHQVIRANSKEAAIGRTIRGNGFVWDHENLALNSAIQLVTEALPDAVPTLQGTAKPPNPSLNRNLLFAMNNARIPDSSLTFYQAGIGRAETSQGKITNLLKLPKASYNGVWIGLSPITERTIFTTLGYQLTSDRRVLKQSGGEGGINDSVNFISVINNDRFSSSNLEDFYTQVYLTVFEHDADLVNRVQQVDRIRYSPHLSYTGNVTSADSVLRYYMGAILGESLNAYIGADYSRSTAEGWSYSVGGIGYSNPDYDYYSRLSGRLSKRFRLSNRASFSLGARATWAIDQDTQIQDLDTNAQGSSVAIEARGTFSPISVGFTQVFGDLLPNSIEESSVVDVSLQLGAQLFVTGFVTLANQNTVSNRYGLGLQWRLNTQPDSPIFGFAWRNTLYDYGFDSFDRAVRLNNNTFSLSFRMGF